MVFLSIFLYSNGWFVCVCEQYVDKQDLSSFISLTDDCSHGRKLDAARFHLRLEDDDIYLTVRDSDLDLQQKIHILLSNYSSLIIAV